MPSIIFRSLEKLQEISYFLHLNSSMINILSHYLCLNIIHITCIFYSCYYFLLLNLLRVDYTYHDSSSPETRTFSYLVLVKWSEGRSVVSDSLQPHGLYSPWNSPGQNTGVGSLSLLQGIFPTQGSNPGPPHYRQTLYHLSYQGSSIILEWVAYPFTSRSSPPRNQTGVSCVAV